MSSTCGWRKDAKLFSVRKDVYGSLELVEGQVEDAIVTSGFSNRINSTGCVIVYKIYSVLIGCKCKKPQQDKVLRCAITNVGCLFL